jgi:virulence-associated protein VagC
MQRTRPSFLSRPLRCSSRKQGDEVVLSARPEDWSPYLISGPVASKEFMDAVEDLPMQER